MLKTDFQNDIQLHAVPLSRIKQFRDASQAEPMRTIIIKLDTRTVGPKVMKEIREMILGYGCDLTYLYGLLTRREYRRYCVGQKFIQLRRRLREAFRAEQKQNPNLKTISKGGLQGKVWKTALEDACHLFNRYWRSAQERARSNIRNLPIYQKLNDAERYYIGTLLKRIDDRFFDLLDGKTPVAIIGKSVKGTIRKIRPLANLVRAEVRKAAGRTPCHSRCRSLTLTNECYTVIKNKDGKYAIPLLSKNHSQLGFWIARQYVVGTKLMIKKWPQVYS